MSQAIESVHTEGVCCDEKAYNRPFGPYSAATDIDSIQILAATANDYTTGVLVHRCSFQRYQSHVRSVSATYLYFIDLTLTATTSPFSMLASL